MKSLNKILSRCIFVQSRRHRHRRGGAVYVFFCSMVTSLCCLLQCTLTGFATSIFLPAAIPIFNVGQHDRLALSSQPMRAPHCTAQLC